jgi:type II secretory pathway pseudopilin PulG
MIITLAVIAALLTVLAVSLVKRLDRIAREKEIAVTRTLGNAFKEGVRMNRYVPDHTQWAAAVATQLGCQVNEVTQNERNFARIFLIDPNIQIGINNVPLPYAQGASGSVVTNLSGNVVRPQNTRFLIISTLGSPLPSTLVSGVGDTSGANAFANIWNTPEGQIPAGWTFSIADDLKIERVDLVDLFVPISLWNNDSGGSPSFAISLGANSFETNNVAFQTAPPDPLTSIRYYVRGSELRLFSGSLGGGVNQYSEIVFNAHDFEFELGAWTAKAYLGRGAGTPYGKDLQRAADLFMRAPVNQYAQHGATQQRVYDAMVAYMQAFIDWRDGTPRYEGENCPGPVANNIKTTALQNARDTLGTEAVNLINPR